MCVLAGAFQAHALSAQLAGDVLAVHADVDGATRGADEASLACIPSADIVHVAIGGIGSLNSISTHVRAWNIVHEHTVKKLNLSKNESVLP